MLDDGSWLNDGRFYLLPRDKWCDSTIPPVQAYAQRQGYWHAETDGPVPDHPGEILERAGLNWRVLRTPVYATLPGHIPGLGGIPATAHRALVREDTEQVLAVVGRDYSPIQNSTAATAVVDPGPRGLVHLAARSRGPGNLPWSQRHRTGENAPRLFTCSTWASRIVVTGAVTFWHATAMATAGP